MYIRRKVFSLNDYDYDYDYDYGYSERWFGEDEGMSTAAKVGLGLAGTGALVGAGIYGHKKGWFGKAKEEAKKAIGESTKSGYSAEQRAANVADEILATKKLGYLNRAVRQAAKDPSKTKARIAEIEKIIANNPSNANSASLSKELKKVEKLQEVRGARLRRKAGENNYISSTSNGKKGNDGKPISNRVDLSKDGKKRNKLQLRNAIDKQEAEVMKLRKQYMDAKATGATKAADFNEYMFQTYGNRMYSDLTDYEAYGIYERAFSDGYYEAMFSNDSDENAVAKGAAIGALTAAGVAGAGFGLGRGAQKLSEKQWEELEGKGFKEGSKKRIGKASKWGAEKSRSVENWIKDNWAREAAEGEGKFANFAKGKGKVLGAGAGVLAGGAAAGAGINAYRHRND